MINFQELNECCPCKFIDAFVRFTDDWEGCRKDLQMCKCRLQSSELECHYDLHSKLDELKKELEQKIDALREAWGKLELIDDCNKRYLK